MEENTMATLPNKELNRLFKGSIEVEEVTE